VVYVLWGAIAEACLGGVLLYWSSTAGVASRRVFGRRGSVAVLVVAMLATAVNAATALISPARSDVLFWFVAFPLFLAASCAVLLAFGSLFSPKRIADVAAGILLAVGIAAMYIVAWQIFRL
jgi:hypothetical protein